MDLDFNEEQEGIRDMVRGVLAEYGARLYSPKMNAPKEWSGGVSGAMKALRLYLSLIHI